MIAASLLAACSSGGGGGGTEKGGNGGAGGQGQAGTGASTAGAAGTQSAGTGGLAGTGGSAIGSGGSVAGTSGGAGSSGTTGQAGTGAAAGTTGAAGRGGAGGITGAAGTTGNAGRGGTTGGGGSSGGSAGSSPDGGVPSPVTPTQSGGSYRFTWGDVVMEVDAQVGARVGKLSLAGTDLIMTSAMAARVDGGLDPTTWGSVFWTSPRSAWTPQTWPPPVNIDGAPYTTTIAGTHVTASGPADTSIGVSMAKDYSADATSGWIKIGYTIKATKAQRAAPWEVSRVPRGGIVFFPVPSSSAVTKGPLTITVSNNIVWFDDAPKTATSPNGDKLYADGTTWTAYLLGRNLFLKRFTDTPAAMQPAMEGEIDVYPGNGFLEFEVQGPYTMIAANGNLPWSIEWKVVTVPSSIAVTAGSAALADFAKQQAAQ
ncbi:MAG TPA: hypothetical protein VN903_17395 [Polyangia bacterium]|nr:hypothetical protein [Polyangia bacterium]